MIKGNERIEQKYNTTGKQEMLRLTITTNHLRSHVNDDSRTDTIKDNNDEVEKMKSILKAINENRETKPENDENSQDNNSNKVEEEKGDNDQREINHNNINPNSIELQIIKENESEEKEEIEKNNTEEEKNFELTHSRKSSSKLSEEYVPEVNIKNDVEMTQENVPKSLNEIVNDLNKNLKSNNSNIIENNRYQENDKEMSAEKNNKQEKEKDNQNISEEEDDDDDDSSIIDDLDYDEDADNKIPNSGNEKIKLDETILLHLSQMNMSVKEEQLPKSVQAVRQKT